MTRIINSNRFLCIPEPGKPDPYDPRRGAVRRRVEQKRQKGPTCFYYALQILRDGTRVGKAMRPSEVVLRKKEKIISDYRKAITENGLKEREYTTLAEKIKEALLSNQFPYTRQGLIDFLGIKEGISKEKVSAAVSGVNAPPFFSGLLVDFLFQKKRSKLNNFINNYFLKLEYKESIDLINRLDLPDSYIGEQIPELKGENWSQMGRLKKISYCASAVMVSIYHAYGLEFSSWSPTMPMVELTKQLQQYGPHYVIGHIGGSYYSKPLLRAADLEGRPVFKLEPDKKIEDVDSHAVVIVGTLSTAEEEFVCILDPNDGSTPNNPTTQKVYLLAYNELKKSLRNVLCLQTDPSSFLTPNEGYYYAVRRGDS